MKTLRQETGKTYVGTVAMNMVNTICDGNRKIKIEIISLLEELDNLGLLPVVVGGLPVQDILRIFDEFTLEFPHSRKFLEKIPISGSGGATFYYGGQLHVKESFSKNQVKAFVKYCDEHNLRYQLFSTTGERLFPADVKQRFLEEIKKRCQQIGVDKLPDDEWNQIQHDFRDIFGGIELRPEQLIHDIDQLDLDHIEICQMGAFSFNQSVLGKMIPEMSKEKIDADDSGQGNYNECSPEGINKYIGHQTAIKFLKEAGILTRTADIHFAIGKGKKDEPMLSGVEKGHAYILANGSSVLGNRPSSTVITVSGAKVLNEFTKNGTNQALENIAERTRNRRMEQSEDQPQISVEPQVLLLNMNHLLDRYIMQEKELQAIDKAIENGVHVILFSDKSFPELKKIRREMEEQYDIHLDCFFVALSGAEVYDQNEQLVRQGSFSEIQIRAMINLLNKGDRGPFCVHTNMCTYYGLDYQDLLDRTKYELMKSNKSEELSFEQLEAFHNMEQYLTQVTPEKTIMNTNEFLSQLRPREVVLQVTAFTFDEQKRGRWVENTDFREMGILPTHSDNYHTELIRSEYSKENAVEEILTHLGIKEDCKITAIGTRQCDEVLMACAHIKYATHDATDKVKQMVNYELPQHSSVSQVVDNLLQSRPEVVTKEHQEEKFTNSYLDRPSMSAQGQTGATRQSRMRDLQSKLRGLVGLDKSPQKNEEREIS